MNDSLDPYQLINNIYQGIGEELQNFGSDKGVEMKFYTSKDTRNMNALCQYWEMSETGSQTGFTILLISLIFMVDTPIFLPKAAHKIKNEK